MFFNKELFGDGACGILFGGKLNFGLGIKHGWKPLGKQRCVTKSVGNVVYEIDNAPAVKVYEEYFGAETIKLKKRIKKHFHTLPHRAFHTRRRRVPFKKPALH